MKNEDCGINRFAGGYASIRRFAIRPISLLDPGSLTEHNVSMNCARALFAAAILVLFFSACDGAERKTPEGFTTITITPDRGDFGVVNQGDPAQFTVEIENLGPGNITLLGIEGGCPEPDVKFENFFLLPGQKTKAEVSIDTTEFPGRMERQLAIRTGNIETPIFPFQVSGFVKPNLIITPEHYRFYRDEVKNQKNSLTSSLQNLSEKDVIVESIESSGSSLKAWPADKAEYPITIPAGGIMDIRIDIQPVKDDETFAGKVIIRMKNAAKNRYEISIVEKKSMPKSFPKPGA